jgi:hypothetical protein
MTSSRSRSRLAGEDASNGSRTWRPILVLPGVELSTSVEGGALVAIGPSDHRYAAVCSNPHVKRFLSRFLTPFGESLNPSLIIRRLASKPRADEVTSFRDVIALPRVIEARASGRSGTLWSDYFDPYPAMVTQDGMISITAGAISDIRFQEQARKFRGQVAPILFDARGMRSRTDPVLEGALLKAWQWRPAVTDRKAVLFRRRLFRSTAFAFHALRVSSVLAERSERATWLSLFVAAFETLVHPDSGKVAYSHVSGAIRSIPWESKRLRSANARIHYVRGGKVVYKRSTHPVQIYHRLYRLRNEWLHGTELRSDRLERSHHPKWGSLETQVPALYRALLLTQLGSNGVSALPPALDATEEIIRAMTQTDFEKPLLGKEKPWRI